MSNQFKGMTETESIGHQLSEWVKGNSLHNPIRDECCPDFSCCNGGEAFADNVRIKFADAYKMGDKKLQWEILGMALSGECADLGIKVHIAGEDNIEH